MPFFGCKMQPIELLCKSLCLILFFNIFFLLVADFTLFILLCYLKKNLFIVLFRTSIQISIYQIYNDSIFFLIITSKIHVIIRIITRLLYLINSINLERIYILITYTYVLFFKRNGSMLLFTY